MKKIYDGINKVQTGDIWHCAVCGTPFVLTRERAYRLRNNKTAKQFCSTKCSAKYLHEQSIIHKIRDKTHGETQTRLFRIWVDMRRRCSNKNRTWYKRYGGRGITVCEEWASDFQAFYDWSMENGYSDNLTIDRINNDGNYEPSNCRWITTKEQLRNTSRTVYVEYGGESIPLRQLADEKGLSWSLLYHRIKKGMDIETAIAKPAREIKRKEC